MIHKIDIDCMFAMEILDPHIEDDILFNVEDSIWETIQTIQPITIVSHQNYINVFFRELR